MPPLGRTTRRLPAVRIRRRTSAQACVARHTRTLTRAAQPPAADAVLAVEAHEDLRRAPVLARLPVPVRHQLDVRRRNDRVRPPLAARRHRVRSRSAVAVHARRLLHRLALLSRALEQRAVVLVLAHQLVRPVAAVLHAVAALRVRHNLPTHALEPALRARSRDVVAHRARKRAHRKQRNKRNKQLRHLEDGGESTQSKKTQSRESESVVLCWCVKQNKALFQQKKQQI